MDQQLRFESGRVHGSAVGNASLAIPNKYHIPNAATQQDGQVGIDGVLRDHDSGVLERKRNTVYLLSILI